MKSIMLAICLALPMTCLAAAQNLVANPSAETAGKNGQPQGWGLYQGSGRASLTTTTTEKHSGQRSALLEISGWYQRPGQPDTPANHSYNVAIVLAPNDGYRANGALPCQPDSTYVFSFWYKGNLPSAQVIAQGWPSTGAGLATRVGIPVNGGQLSPAGEWRCCAGTLSIPRGIHCFAPMIRASGTEVAGYRLGKLYVDDVRVLHKGYPDGELRGVWWWGPQDRGDRTQAMQETTAMLDRLKATGFNTILLSLNSLYVAALQRPELQQEVPGSAWDYYGAVIKAAQARGLQVHAWYPPWTYKNVSRSIELRDHPDWAVVNAQGVKSTDSICFVRPEVRQFELNLIRYVLLRYPGLSGIHIEEPGHPTCHCDYCAKLCQDWLGLDIRKDPAAAEPALRNLAAFMNADFFARLRQMVLQINPALWISANGSAGANPDFSIARDWPTWSRRGYIDFYVPQVYTDNPARFATLAAQTRDCLGGGDMVTGMAVSWSGIYPRRVDPQVLTEEIQAARKLGAKGFVIFRAALLEDAHFKALKNLFDADKRG